jgi:hypothetical protein
MLLIVSMGIPNKRVDKTKEGFRFGKAVIQIIDWHKKKIIKELTYQSPPEHLARGLSMQFKGAAIDRDQYYVVTNTELLIYDMNTWKLENVISNCSFNDLHGVLPMNNYIYLCNTGLEVVQKLGRNGTIIEEINLASTSKRKTYEPTTDFRMIPTTKPHEVHINHLFSFNNTIWATRGNMRDAVDIYNRQQALSFRESSRSEETILCHDGILRDDRLYFTTVNAHIICMDPGSGAIIQNYDINMFSPKKRNIGWTRGLEISDSRCIVGITKMRFSNFKEYTNWMVGRRDMAMPSSLIEIDLANKRLKSIYPMEKYKGHAIYSIHRL